MNEFQSSNPKTRNSTALQAVLMVVFGACLLLIINAARKNSAGLNPFLLFACAVGALIIPAASHDYTLSILPMAVVFLMLDDRFFHPNQSLFSGILLFVFFACYSSTLFSPVFKPAWLSNNFPAIMMMLIVAVIMAVKGGPTVGNE